MTEEKEISKDKNKLVAKIALKTMSYIFIGIMLFVCISFYLSPKLSLKISQYLGSASAQEVAYKRIYAKSGKNVDLYNLIQFNQKQNDLSDELKYINELMSKDNYKEFCSALDKASLSQVDSNELIPYMCDVNAYLRSQKVICMYALESEFETYLLVQTSAGELSDLSFAVYIDLIHSDKTLTDTEKLEKIIILMDKGIIVDKEFKDADTIIDLRINEIKEKLTENLDLKDKIIMQYSLVRFYKAKYLIATYVDDSIAAESNRLLYNSENAKLIALY